MSADQKTTQDRLADLATREDELRRLDAGHGFTPDEGRTFPFRGRDVVEEGDPGADDAAEGQARAAGHLDPGESPVQGVIRETLEETARQFTHRLLAAGRQRQHAGGREGAQRPTSATKW